MATGKKAQAKSPLHELVPSIHSPLLPVWMASPFAIFFAPAYFALLFKVAKIL